MPKINFKPSEKQHQAWGALEDGCTETVVYGGAAGGGKSYMGAAWKLYRRLRYPGSRGLTGRTYLKDIRESTLITFFKVLGDWGMKVDRDYTYNASGFFFQFPNGSREIFRDLGYDPSDPDYQRLGSLEITDAWIEEAGDGVPEKAADILKTRIRWMLPEHGLIPKLLITCNPGYHWIRNRYITDADGNPVLLPPSVQVIQALVTDNPDRAFVRLYKKSLQGMSNVYDRQRLLLGDWNAVERTGGEFYPAFDTEKHVGNVRKEYDPALPLHITWDFNTSPHVTCCVWQVVGLRAAQIDEICLPPPLNNTLATARAFAQRYRQHGAEVLIYGDTNGKQADTRSEAGHNDYTIIQRELTAAGLRTSLRLLPANPSVSMRGLWLDAVLKENAGGIVLVFDRGCHNTITDYQKVKKSHDGTKEKTRIKDPKTGISYEPYGHCSDANEYLLCRVFAPQYAAFQRGPQQPGKVGGGVQERQNARPF